MCLPAPARSGKSDIAFEQEQAGQQGDRRAGRAWATTDANQARERMEL